MESLSLSASSLLHRHPGPRLRHPGLRAGMTTMEGGNAVGLPGATLAHCTVLTEFPGGPLLWIPRSDVSAFAGMTIVILS
jgi:hypothetical protein